MTSEGEGGLDEDDPIAGMTSGEGGSKGSGMGRGRRRGRRRAGGG